MPKDASTITEILLRGEVLSEACPSRNVLRHATSRWGSLVLIVLKTGTHRFSELRRKIGGVSERMLAQTLQSLEGDGFVRRVSLPVVPPHVEYSLTPLGSELAGKVAELAEWVEVNMPRITESQARSPVNGRALQRATADAALPNPGA
jgi:DNA-binding HxlR family transcriptional regulator